MTALPAEITIAGLRERVAELLDARDKTAQDLADARDQIGQLTAERDSIKGLLSGSQQELRDAITAQGKAERERDEERERADGWADEYRHIADAAESLVAALSEALPAVEVDSMGDWSKIPSTIEALRAERDEAQASNARLRALLEGAAATLRTTRNQWDRARAAIDQVRGVRTWRNEDGKLFVFADDLRAAVDGSGT